MVIIPTAKGVFDTARTEAMESSRRGGLVARQRDPQQQALGSCKRGSFIHGEGERSEKGSDFTPVFQCENSFYLLFQVTMLILTSSVKCSEIYRWEEASLLSSCKFPDLLLFQFSCLCARCRLHVSHTGVLLQAGKGRASLIHYVNPLMKT